MVAGTYFKDDRQSVRHGGCQEPSAVTFTSAAKLGHCGNIDEAQVGSQRSVIENHGNRAQDVTR